MQFFAEYGLFLAKAITLVISLLILIAGIAAISSRVRSQKREQLTIKKLNDKYDEMTETINVEILEKKALKKYLKEKKQSEKNAKKRKRCLVQINVSLYCILKVI